MEEYGEYLMWMKRKQMLKSYIVQSKTWEERAFAEDAARARVLGVGGCIWPPRSYSCTFCTREFRSAQALGGHMNVHRRDRARLKQSPSPRSLSSSEEKTGHQIMFLDSEAEDHVETDLSVGLNSMFGQSCNKRPKTSVSSSLKPCSNERLPALHSAEMVLGVKPAGMEDLDLELRLGKPQKVV